MVCLGGEREKMMLACGLLFELRRVLQRRHVTRGGGEQLTSQSPRSCGYKQGYDHERNSNMN